MLLENVTPASGSKPCPSPAYLPAGQGGAVTTPAGIAQVLGAQVWTCRKSADESF